MTNEELKNILYDYLKEVKDMAEHLIDKGVVDSCVQGQVALAMTTIQIKKDLEQALESQEDQEDMMFRHGEGKKIYH